MTNLATNLVTTAEQHPDNTMIAMGGKHLSYAVMHQLAAKLAGDLKASGIEPGDLGVRRVDEEVLVWRVRAAAVSPPPS